jgi:hypothetical protein
MQSLLGSNYPRNNLLEQLSPGSDIGKLQLGYFKNLTRDLRIVSFYETHQTRQLQLNDKTQAWDRTGPYVTTVDSNSALLNLPDHAELKVKVDADHSQMVKFNNKEDAPYPIILTHLKKFEREAGRFIDQRFKALKLSPTSLSYRTPFSLRGIPIVNKFVDRPRDIHDLERELLAQTSPSRRKLVVLHGLGGIGKTQLAVEFIRRHHVSFESVLWIDGKSQESLLQGFAHCASRIPAGQIPETSRTYSMETANGDGKLGNVIRDVLEWLSKPQNTKWLIVFDNVDRAHLPSDSESYDIKQYLPGADHGAILLTTRLSTLRQLGVSKQLGRVNQDQAHAIFANWYQRSYGTFTSLSTLLLYANVTLLL